MNHVQKDEVTDKIAIHKKYVTKAFHKFGKQAQTVVRLHAISRLHFKHGSFTMDEMAQILTDNYGYSWLNRGSIVRLKEIINKSEWFVNSGDNYYRFKSWTRIVGVKKYDRIFYSLDYIFLLIHLNLFLFL